MVAAALITRPSLALAVSVVTVVDDVEVDTNAVPFVTILPCEWRSLFDDRRC